MADVPVIKHNRTQSEHLVTRDLAINVTNNATRNRLTQTVKCCVCVKSAEDDLGMIIGGMCKTNKSEISKFKSPPSSVTSFDRIWRKLS